MKTDDKFQRVCEIFEQARHVPTEERNAFVRDVCGSNAGLRKEVEELLTHHAHETGLLDRPITPASAHEIANQLQQAFMPERIGRYTILRKLGEGGMGVVYLAKQDQPAREVAIKVMRPGLMSKEMLRRFDLETAVLGRLQHPNVAQIYEAGIDEQGGVHRPFFVMEYVEGQALDEYVREKAPSVRQRLALFTQICDAVHHAHQKGVIHRDLKPSNIVVVAPTTSSSELPSGSAPQERPPSVKILDFGVARSTDADLQVTSLRTDLGQLIGTLPYMSPEQISGQAHDVDTRSDVYALGVVLYELLAGKLPYELNEQAIVKAVQIITEQDPVPLSTVSSVYRGDLNTIALKALEKSPDRRYSSASDLAADVQRYLDNQPIVARRASAMYQLRKFASRNKGWVAGMTAAAVMLIIGVIASSVFAIGQTRALRESERQRAIAEAVVEFINEDLLLKADPHISAKKETTVREVLDAASASVGDRFANQPEVAASIRYTLGRSYQGLGRFEEAAEHVSRALSFFEKNYEATDERLYEVRSRLAQNILAQWKIDEVEPMLRQYVRLAEQHLGNQHPWTAKLLAKHAVALKRSGQFAEAEKMYLRALDILDDLGDEHGRTRIVVSNNLALVLRDQDKLQEAEVLLREVVESGNQLFGGKNLDGAFGLTSLGDVLWHQATDSDADPMVAKGQLDEAERLFRDALTTRQALLGDEHPDTANSMYAIGLIYSARKDYEEGERWQRKALAIRRKAFGTDEHVDVLNSMNAVATALRHQERYEEAKEISQQSLEIAERCFGVEHYSSNRYRRALYAALWNLGDAVAIEELNQNYKDRFPEEKQAWGMHALAEAHATNGDVEMAIEVKRRAIKRLPIDSSLREHWQARLEALIELEPGDNKVN